MLKHNIIQSIAEAIEPYVGKVMAKSSIDAHCKRLGISGDTTLTTKMIDELIEQLALGLRVFIGREKTDTLVQQIRMRVRGVAA